MYVGFDEDDLNCHCMALDPERVGLDNIEVPQICDFGDNVLDYMTRGGHTTEPDRKSTRLNSSHGYNSYAVFCLKKT